MSRPIALHLRLEAWLRRLRAAVAAAPRAVANVSLFAKAAGALSIVAVAVTVARPAAAAPLDPHGEDWEGLSQLVAIAEEELGVDHVVVTPRLRLDTALPNDALMIVHPQRALDVDALFAFVRAGGRVTMLDDFGRGDALLAALDARRVALPRRPRAMLRSNPALAIAESVGLHPLVHDVTRVVTNHATGIAGGALQPLLVVSGDGTSVAVAGAAVLAKGRIVVIGDSSVLMNAMLRYPGNRSLASALLATNGPARAAGSEAASGARPNGKLYLLVNDFTLEGRFASLDAGGPGASARGGPSDAFGGLSALGAFGGRAGDALRSALAPSATYLAALFVGAGIVVWTGMGTGKTYRPSTPLFVRATPLAAQGGVAGYAAALGERPRAAHAAWLELHVALEERLLTRLGLAAGTAAEAIVRHAQGAGLVDDEGARLLRAALERLARERRASARRGDDRPRASPFRWAARARMRRTAPAMRALVAAVERPVRGKVVAGP